jgi:pimeloyl-ACP methyl ester carboxylesterase
VRTTKKFSIATAVAAAAVVAGFGISTASASAAPQHAAAANHQPRPTVVLLAGAFEGNSSWDGVTSRLQRDGYTVIAPALPLRGLASDTAFVTSELADVKGPIVVAGHSYGGLVATEVAAVDKNVKALVYAAAFIPVKGENAGQLDASYPGSLLGTSTFTEPSPDGTDVYVRPDAFRALFAEDSSQARAALDGVDQRPITAAALSEAAQYSAPADVAKYAIVANDDMAIPPAAEQFEAQRAGAHISHVNSSHDLPFSHPGAVTAVIEQAAR